MSIEWRSYSLSATSLWGRWTNPIPSFHSVAHCEIPSSSLFSSFKAHFNPKYDVPKPTHRHDWLTPKRVSAIVLKRVALDAYFAFTMHLHEMLEKAQEPDDIDFSIIFMESVYQPMSHYFSAGVQEWIAEGIRIAYAKYIIDNWLRKTTWKFLKGPVQSSLRKYSRRGMLAFPRACWCEARGNVVMSCASSTWRMLRHPWTHRGLYLSDTCTLKDKASYFLRFLACELVCLGARIVGVGIGGAIGSGMGYMVWKQCGGNPSTDRWKQLDGGKDSPLPTAIFMPWAMSFAIADSVVQGLLRPQVEEALGLLVVLDSDDMNFDGADVKDE